MSPEEQVKPKDKRTKEYKDWKANFDNQNSKGIGDVVESIAKKTGIKKVVETFVDGKDCGCDKRKEKLNKLPFRFNPVRCFTEDQYNEWTVFRNKKNNTVTHTEQINIIIPIYAQLFARQLKPMSCCVEPYIKDIDKVYEDY